MDYFSTLIVSAGDRSLVRLRTALVGLGGTRFVVTASLQEACDLMEIVGPRVVIVHCDAGSQSEEQVDLLLWMNTRLRRPARVVFVDERYSDDQARSLFRLGVDDYLSDPDHSDHYASILGRLLGRIPAQHGFGKTAGQETGVRTGTPAAASARWTAAAPA
jgi:DNA-binding NarL/FixJ family response regulator